MQKKIIIFITILFIASSFWLFYQSDKQTNPDLNKNWWAVYFVDPKSDNLNFIIENHSDKNDFHWEILADKNKVKEDNIKIEKGAQSELNSDSELSSDEFKNKKITVDISSGDEKKEIYKNFNKK